MNTPSKIHPRVTTCVAITDTVFAVNYYPAINAISVLGYYNPLEMPKYATFVGYWRVKSFKK